MRRKLAFFGAFGLSALLGAAACAPVKVLNAITPSASFEKDKNISYGPLARQTLDIYRADTPKAGAPLLVFVHGGSWESGNKDLYKFLAEGFTSRGYDMVVPNYRLYPEVKYPGFVEDTAKALAFTAAQFPDRRLVVMGHSAGAYNILMSILEPSFYPGGAAAACASIAGLISLAGPTGVGALGSEPYVSIFPERLFGSDAPLNNVAPLAPSVGAGEPTRPLPAFFFGHGLDDKTVYPQNSQKLAAKINSSGGTAVLKLYDGLDHTGIIRVLSRHFEGGASVKTDIVAFIDGLDLSAPPDCGA